MGDIFLFKPKAISKAKTMKIKRFFAREGIHFEKTQQRLAVGRKRKRIRVKRRYAKRKLSRK